MRERMKRSLSIAALGAMLGGAATVAPAHAQTVPPPPVIGPVIAGCAVAAGVSPCLGTVIPVSPVVVIPGFGGGSRNVDVDQDVDRSRTPGRVVIIQ